MINNFFESIRRLIRGNFVRNVAVMATGTAGAQVITMIVTPIVTRLYAPESFGQLGTFMAILAVMTPISALSYPIAIVLPKTDSEAISIAKTSIIVACCLFLVSIVVLTVMGDLIVGAFGLEMVADFLLLIPICMLFSAFLQVAQQWLIRNNQFKYIARVTITQSFVLNATKVAVGVFYPIGVSLIIIATLANAIHAFLLWRGVQKNDRFSFSLMSRAQEKEVVSSLLESIIKYKSFPIYRAPQLIVNTLSNSLPVIMLAVFFGSAVAGYFTLSISILSAPAILLGQSVGSVFFPRIVNAIEKGENIFKLFSKSILVLFIVGIVPFFLIFIISEDLFPMVFGSEWGEAGLYAKWLSVNVFLGLVHRPCESLIQAKGYNKFYFIYEFFFLVVSVSVLYLSCIRFENALIVIMFFSCVKCFYYLGLIGFGFIASARGK